MTNYQAMCADVEIPVFCGRICKFCHGPSEEILIECPVIKLDAYLQLKSEGGMAHAAKNLSSSIRERVDDDLIRRVASERGGNGRHDAAQVKSGNA